MADVYLNNNLDTKNVHEDGSLFSFCKTLIWNMSDMMDSREESSISEMSTIRAKFII